MRFKIGLTIDEISIGDKASFSKTVSETDIYLFAGITGDLNPMHVNEEFAKRTPFGSRVAHGGITSSLIAPVLGTLLPGLGTIALELFCRFKAPVYPGDTITASAEVIDKTVEKNIVTLKLSFINQNGKEVADGQSKVMPPKKELKNLIEE